MSRRSSRSDTTSSTVAHRDVRRSRSSVGVSLNGTNVRSHSYEAFIAKKESFAASLSLVQRVKGIVGAASSGDLVKESHVGIVENPYVGDVVAKHRDPGRSHPERPAAVPI